MSISDFKFSFKLGHKGIANLFQVMKGRGGKVRIGFIGPKAGADKKPGSGEEAPSGQTVAEVAAQHEFGLGVPQRSMIRAWTDTNQSMIRDDIRKAMDVISMGRLTPEMALKVLGVKWVASLQEFIATPSNFLPLSQATIDRKGSTSPLIDTGQMRSSVTYEHLKE